MVNWTSEQAAAYERKQANNRSSRLRPAQPQPTQGHALVSAPPGEEAGRSVPLARFKIVFTVYAVRPCDYDGLHIKELQDMLVEAGLLHGDQWNELDGEVRSRKAHTKEEERTVIEIERL